MSVALSESLNNFHKSICYYMSDESGSNKNTDNALFY